MIEFLFLKAQFILELTRVSSVQPHLIFKMEFYFGQAYVLISSPKRKNDYWLEVWWQMKMSNNRVLPNIRSCKVKFAKISEEPDFLRGILFLEWSQILKKFIKPNFSWLDCEQYGEIFANIPKYLLHFSYLTSRKELGNFYDNIWIPYQKN